MTGGNDNRRRSDGRQKGKERSSAESSTPDETKTEHELNRSDDEDALENDLYPEEPLEDTLPEPAPEDIGEDSAIVPDEGGPYPYFTEEPQLSPEERVPQSMGTIALERVPGDRRAANGVMPPFLGGMAGELAHMTDAEIMQRAGAGDDTCFEFLVAKYRRPIIGFMYRMVHNQAVAEELTQEVFLRVYRARSSYRAEARFTTWLYRIASNMAINHARDTKHERASSSIYLDQADEETGTTPDVADLRPLAEQDLLHNERMRRIREHVAALPERQRMAVVMHKYQDMGYKQIGAVLKLSESATKSLLFRAYQTLRDRLKEFA
jgi:RNA polymerase sigma-70 factor (ECF subfamily)